MTKKLTYEEIKTYIENFNYKLLSKEYKNNRSKLLLECNNGHLCEICFSDFKRGRRCSCCYDERRGCSQRLSYEDIKKYIELFDYELLSSEYWNNQSKLSLKCPLGHEFKMTYGHFQQGQRCPHCNKCKKLTYEEVKRYIEDFKYKLLSNIYENTKEKLLIECPEKHIFEMNFHNFKQRQRCPHCKGVARHTLEEVKQYIEAFDYILLSEMYVNNKEKLFIQCPHGHKYEVNFHSFEQGARCPICNVSKGEQKIINWLNKNNIKYIYNQPYFDDLKGINGGFLRPDFILPDYKIWIEYDGEFHYKEVYKNDDYKTTQIHDEIKNEYARKNEWKLIRIPYWDYDNIENILMEEF